MAGDLSSLKHTRVNLPSGGKVMVLDTGAVINAEAAAMIQALHSRSTGGLEHHLSALAERGPENFMKNFYVGYGHKSIGDCGTTTVFVEGVSMLAAKAIQDNPLYSGQEASTRYVDFSEQAFIDPTKTAQGAEIMERQRAFYLAAQDPTREHLRTLHPPARDENMERYEKAINARAFDITRSLLPAGASTNLAWHTNLRQAADKLLFLRHHPLEEVRGVAEGTEEALKTHHPNSFGHKRYDATEAFQDTIAARYYFHDPESPREPRVNFDGVNIDELEAWRELFKERPAKTELPKFLAHIGTVDVDFRLDYGSFRDIQRHRAITQRMPLLTTELGFNEWYVANLPESVLEQLPEHLDNVRGGIERLGVTKEEAQFFTPMGYDVANRFTGDLPATIYMVELRDSRFVHPTLQRVAHNIGNQITNELGIPLHVDSEPNRFDTRRGEQDIKIK